MGACYLLDLSPSIGFSHPDCDSYFLFYRLRRSCLLHHEWCSLPQRFHEADSSVSGFSLLFTSAIGWLDRFRDWSTPFGLRSPMPDARTGKQGILEPENFVSLHSGFVKI